MSKLTKTSEVVSYRILGKIWCRTCQLSSEEQIDIPVNLRLVCLESFLGLTTLAVSKHTRVVSMNLTTISSWNTMMWTSWRANVWMEPWNSINASKKYRAISSGLGPAVRPEFNWRKYFFIYLCDLSKHGFSKKLKLCTLNTLSILWF